MVLVILLWTCGWLLNLSIIGRDSKPDWEDVAFSFVFSFASLIYLYLAWKEIKREQERRNSWREKHND